ncbi:MAG: tRNA epoxyqueuosine(34) reductase QueG [Saprospiraceae bacterium]|nr:tRNA epoxyqueuosine(34) reductase QueG [Saprospiraceae bacterium]
MFKDQSYKTKWIKEKAHELGFSGVGIAQAQFMEEEAENLRKWLDLGYHGTMSYMTNHFDKRVDPTELVDNAKSVICLMYNYYNPEVSRSSDYKVSMYAQGRDYHKVIKKKLKGFFREIETTFGQFSGRYFVDSAPVLERDWAKRSGLGWIGKNTLLITPQKGSYFFLCEMIVDFALDYDAPIDDFCGSCTKCIDACPTNAIDNAGYVMDGSKCISYLTIELKEDIPEKFKDQMEDNIFGCDICQEVCPWNRFSTPHSEKEFLPGPQFSALTNNDWENMTEAQFDQLFEVSAVKRTGFKGLKRNIKFVKKNK